MGSCLSKVARAAGVLTLVALVVAPDFAIARTSLTPRRACRAACGALIELCHRAGAKRRFCRRNVIRGCRHAGLAYCQIDRFSTTTTLTTATSTTTTTLDAGPTVHGCNRLVAQDHRGEATVRVEFTAFDYAPECIVVSPDTSVRFSGDFATFPLIGGAYPDDDPASPFSPPTESGYQKTFVMAQPGVFPYHSSDAWVALFRMWGAVIVE